MAETEKLRVRREKQREANRRWYAKKKAEQAVEIPTLTPEEIAAAEQTEQEKREERQKQKREYKRDWARQDRANKSAAKTAIV